MAFEVFISYARGASTAHALALRDTLRSRGHSVFLDTSEIEPAARFQDELAAAFRDAGAIVVFADPSYFTREWCLRELDAAIIGGAHRLVVALPEGNGAGAALLRFPPGTASRSWPKAGETAALATAVERVLADKHAVSSEQPARSPLLPEVMVRPAAFRADQPSELEGAPESLDNDYVGRADELWRVFHALETRRFAGPPRVVLLSGGAGSGKTQLAAEFARRLGPRYFDAVFWTRADAPDEQRRAKLASILETLRGHSGTPADNPSGALPENVQVGALLAQWGRAGKHVLWVIDNIPEPEAGKPAAPLEYWCTGYKYVSVLVTSRRHHLHEASETLQLAPLDAVAGTALLTRPPVDHHWLEDDEWASVVRWVGGLPQALRILQAALGAGSITPHPLLERSRRAEPAAELDTELAALQEVLPAGALRGIDEAFSMSLDALRADPAAYLALGAWALLPPWPIGEPLSRFLATDKIILFLGLRGWLQAATGRGHERQWRLHRVAASFVRSHVNQDTSFAHLLTALDTLLDTPAGAPLSENNLGWILSELTDRVTGLALRQDADHRLAALAERIALKATFFRLADRDWAGVRNSGAGWLRQLVSWDVAIPRATEIVRTGSPEETLWLPNALQALGRIPQIASLVAELLERPQAEIRRQVLVHASSYRADVMLPRILERAASDPDPTVRDNVPLTLRSWIDTGGPALATVAAYCETRLSQGQVSLITIRTAGEVLDAVSRDDSGILDRLRKALETLATAPAARVPKDLAMAAAAALARRFSAATVDALTSRLRESGPQPDSPDRLRAIEVLGEHLGTLDAPNRPTDIRIELNDEGVPVLSGRLPPKIHQPELSQPLLDLVRTETGAAAARALTGLLSYTAGHQALTGMIPSLFESDAARVEWIATAWIANDATKEPRHRDPNPRWWRGMLREARGEVAGALEDYEAVIALAPGVGYAHKRIARLSVQSGGVNRAEKALAAARQLLPDDPELPMIEAAIRDHRQQPLFQ